MSTATPAPAPKEPTKDPVDAADLLEVRARRPAPYHTRAPPRAMSHTRRSAPYDTRCFVVQEDDEFEEFEVQEWTSAAEDVQDPEDNQSLGAGFQAHLHLRQVRMAHNLHVL